MNSEMNFEFTKYVQQMKPLLTELNRIFDELEKIAKQVPYREPSDWDHHFETPEQTKERDELIVRHPDPQ